jgi:hypothetical protein
VQGGVGQRARCGHGKRLGRCGECGDVLTDRKRERETMSCGALVCAAIVPCSILVDERGSVD